MTRCPLPIDWLDLLDGRPSVATHAHLAECASCRTVVASLSGSASPSGSQLSRLTDQPTPRPTPVPQTSAPLQTGQLYWLKSPGYDDRLPVLVLDVLDSSDGGDSHGVLLADVAPLWVDDDNATDVDLLLTESDSTTQRRWRVIFRRQTLVPRQALHSVLGRLTGQGLALVTEVLGGQFFPKRSGPPLESEFDARLDADSWMDPLLAAASATTYADDSSEDEARQAPQTSAAVVLQFQLRKSSASRPASYQLAAAPLESGRRITEAALNDEATGIVVKALLSLDFLTDQLRLTPTSVTGLNRPVQIVVHTAVLEQPLAVNAELVSGESVTLSEGEGISERDVTVLEMHLL